jgi:flagellar basal-body rod protein FlgF
MDQSAVAAASGLHSRMEALDMLANNLANSSTTGFKLDREFYSLFTSEDDTSSEGPSQLPFVKSQWTDFTQGTLTPTGNPLDLALTGQGFFVASGPSGPLYTRNGSFKISSGGALTTADGYTVQGAGGGAIQTQSRGPIDISPDGTVAQDGQTIGQLQIVSFKDTRALQKQSGTYFVNAQPNAASPEPSTATVSQGQLEGSNVVAAESAVRLVGVMRQFEMLQKAVMTTTDMNKQAITEVARVGGGA